MINNIFILDLQTGFTGLGKDNYDTRRETFLGYGASYITSLTVITLYQPIYLQTLKWHFIKSNKTNPLLYALQKFCHAKGILGRNGILAENEL